MEAINVKEIIGFHGTKLRFADSIISDNFKIAEIKSTDNHWLGHGVYFYEDYELAEWWAESKAKTHRKKYGSDDEASVIKARIIVNNIIDLDNPFELNRFSGYCQEIEADIVKSGTVLDFVMGDHSEKGQIKAEERKRCFFMDAVKGVKGIDAIIYTFSKANPSYAASKYHKEVLEGLGLHYNEKQICVTKVTSIVERTSVEKEVFNEVII